MILFKANRESMGGAGGYLRTGTQIQKWGDCLCSPEVLFTFTPQYNHPQNSKAQVILPTSHTVEAALNVTISQVSEEIPLYCDYYLFVKLNL